MFIEFNKKENSSKFLLYFAMKIEIKIKIDLLSFDE